jgi:hypothetical protein
VYDFVGSAFAIISGTEWKEGRKGCASGELVVEDGGTCSYFCEK